jgi:hypothetical protein
MPGSNMLVVQGIKFATVGFQGQRGGSDCREDQRVLCRKMCPMQ